MGIAYWGRKSKEYMQQILRLYPLGGVDTVIDACMGSGSFSENTACQLAGVECIGIERDKGIYTMHKVIKEQYELLLDRMVEFSYSEQTYEKCRKMTRDFNSGAGVYSEVEIALAELVLLYFSYNGMRGNTPRRFDSYKKWQGEEKKKSERILKTVYDRFFMKAPGNIVVLHSKWQRMQLLNGNFMDYRGFWENPRAWIFIDPPYEPRKRGVEHCLQKTGNLGYDFDMGEAEHDRFISLLGQYYGEGRLRAKMMICTNYETDDNGRIKIPADDRYSKLLELGFTRVPVENKACSNMYLSTENRDGGVKRKRHRKMEVVYVNYRVM